MMKFSLDHSICTLINLFLYCHIKINVIVTSGVLEMLQWWRFVPPHAKSTWPHGPHDPDLTSNIFLEYELSLKTEQEIISFFHKSLPSSDHLHPCLGVEDITVN